MTNAHIPILGFSALCLLALPGCGGDGAAGTDAGPTDAAVLPADAAIEIKGWNHPTELGDGVDLPGYEFYRYDVAMANNGDAVIAYYGLDWDSEYDHWGLFKSERRNGAWAHASDFDSENMSPTITSNFRLDYSRAKAQVEMSDSGETVITWVEYADDFDYDGPGGSDPYTVGDSFYMAEYRDLGGEEMQWTFPQDIGDHLNWGYGGAHEMSHVAMNGSGETVIAWAQNNLSGQAGVYKSEFRGGAWAHPTEASDNISPSPIYTTVMPYAAMNDSSDALIAWRQRFSYPQDDFRILRSEYANTSSSWTHPGDLGDHVNPVGNAREPRTALSNNGDAIIVWRQIQGPPSGPFQIYMSEKRSGTWSSPQEGEYISETGSEHQVAMDEAGNTAIVWAESDGTNRRIYLYEYRDSSWNGPTSISPPGSDASRPVIAMAANGDTVVIWKQRESTDTYDQLFMREYRDGSWSAEPTLGDYIGLDGDLGANVEFGTDGDPQIAMRDNGDTLIIWQQHDVIGSDNMLLFISEYRN